MWIVNGVSKDERQTLAQQFGATTSAPAETEGAQDEATRIASVLMSDPALAAFGSSVTITAEPYFIRIDLSDMAERPLFETGDGRLNTTGEHLTRIAGRAISVLPMQVMIEGHTDSHPSRTTGYSNWELSSDRANSARRLLIDEGVEEHRIQGVSGLAHTRPLLQNTPENAAHRRISIVLVIPPKTA